MTDPESSHHSRLDDCKLLPATFAEPLDLAQGTLAIGAAMLGAEHVLGIDIDPAALVTAQTNMDEFDELPVSSSPDCDPICGCNDLMDRVGT